MKAIESITYLPVVGWVARHQDGSYVHIDESNDPVWILFVASISSVQEDLGVDEPDPADENQIDDLILAAFEKMDRTVPDVLSVIQEAVAAGSSPTPVGRVMSGEEAIREGLIPDTPENRRDQWRISSTGTITRDTGAGRPPTYAEAVTEAQRQTAATIAGEAPPPLIVQGQEPPAARSPAVVWEEVPLPGGGFTIRAKEPKAEEAGPRNLTELLFQSVQTGQPLTKEQVDSIIYVDKIRDWLDRRTITPEEAFNLAAPLMENPQHLSEMMTALLSETGQDVPFPEFNAGMSANAPSTQDPTGPGADVVVGEQPNTLAAALGTTGAIPDPTITAVQAAMSSPWFAAMTEDDQIEAIGLAVAGNDLGAYITGQRDGTNPSREEIIRLAHQARAASQGRPPPTFLEGGEVNALAPVTQGPLTRLPSGKLTGAYDPALAATAGMRSEVQENRLQELIFQRDEAARRGAGMPPGVAQEIASLSTRAAFRPGRAQFAGVGSGVQGLQAGMGEPPLSPALGFGGQLPAYGGTPFYPITPGESPQGTFQALGVRGWNKRQQELFKARGPQRKVFG